MKKTAGGKSREELALEKKQELEKRLQDVSGQLNSAKKPQKAKGEGASCDLLWSSCLLLCHCLWSFREPRWVWSLQWVRFQRLKLLNDAAINYCFSL